MVTSCCRPGLVCLSLVCASCSLLVDTGGGPGIGGDVSLPAECAARGFLYLESAEFPPSHGEVALAEAGDYVLDTGAGTLTGPGIAVEGIPVVSLADSMVSFLMVDSLASDGEALLRITGAHPAVIVSRTTIALAGQLKANSSADDAIGLGPGANPDVCDDSDGTGRGTGGVGESGSLSGGGGGGGGFGTRGGKGGAVVDGSDSEGGTPAALPPPAIRGGCRGGAGAGTGGGAGGAGGGAVHLAACESISLGREVNLGGAGGQGSDNALAGGGGGGSGGYLGLDAPQVTVSFVGIAANGGGGGASEGGAGDDGRLGDFGAIGGGGTTMGGNGATENSDVGDGGDGGANGGGGGGGGVGQIVIRALAQPDSAVFSPAPQPIDE